MENEEELEKQPLGDNETKDVTVEVEDVDDPDEARETSDLLKQVHFADGVRRIDYVLVYSKKNNSDAAKEKREYFLRDIQQEGLELEAEEEEEHDDIFIKLHAPFETLIRFAEIMKLMKPMKLGSPDELFPKKSSNLRALARCADFGRIFHHKPGVIPEIECQFTWPFSLDKQYLFAIPENRSEFFTPSERSMIVDYIIRRARFTDKPGMFGVGKLVQDNVFAGAFPLHEGDASDPKQWNERRLLYETWAHPRNIFKQQPLPHIRLYFGQKIALYFAWLGFYTSWVIPASLMGILVVIYGIVISRTDVINKEICNSSVIMCPLCVTGCPFWNLSDSCNMARMARVMDNGANVFFAIFMAFWCTFFLESWKRYQSKLAYQWSVFEFEREQAPPRPEFLSLLDGGRFKAKVNILSGKEEPSIPYWKHKFPVTFFSFASVMLLVALALTFVIGVIVYRVAVYTTLKTRQDTFLNKSASIVSAATAASMNLVVILLLNQLYRRLAVWLTDLEHHRTQPDYDDSLTLKLYLLGFVNFYSSIVYIAFFKGRLFSRCQAGGCLIELCVQMIIIMVGKQVIGAVKENLIPEIRRIIVLWCQKRNQECEHDHETTRWEADYRLDDLGPRPLFLEYFEMMVQFGFMTIFVTAFPLAPFFALLNNIFEIRGDAIKFVMSVRRPVAKRARTIGIWQTILVSLSRLAVLTNACIIALTAEFIPRFVYKRYYSETGTLEGYADFTLAYQNATMYSPGTDFNFSLCRYRAFRNPPWADRAGEKSSIHWEILAARFIFIVTFENVVFFITAVVAWVIPDVSSKLKAVMIREVTLANEIILKAELRRKENRPTVNLTDVCIKVRRRSPAKTAKDGIKETIT